MTVAFSGLTSEVLLAVYKMSTTTQRSVTTIGSKRWCSYGPILLAESEC